MAPVRRLTVEIGLPGYVGVKSLTRKMTYPERCPMATIQRHAIMDYASILGLLAVLIYLWLQ
jgi:hypothetical protein